MRQCNESGYMRLRRYAKRKREAEGIKGMANMLRTITAYQVSGFAPHQQVATWKALEAIRRGDEVAAYGYVKGFF